MFSLIGLVVGIGASAALMGAAVPQPQLQPPPAVLPTTEPELSEVVVLAAEPRYVAPTLRDRIGRIWAPVLINGKGPFRLVLDTGANRSAVLAEVANTLGTSAQSTETIQVRGFTGSAVVGAVQVQRMEIGELMTGAALLPIVADVFGGAEGILGTEGLADKRLFIDFGHDRIQISRSHYQRAPRGFVAIPIKLTRAGLLEVEVMIGSIRCSAIIDTGAQATVGNLELRDALMRRKPADARTESIIGVTLEEARGDSIATPPIHLGEIQINGARVTFGDMFLFQHWRLAREPALLIGMDVLGTFDVVIIDYKMRELQLRTRAE